MPVPSLRDSSLIARKLLRSFLGQLMWTTPSTNLVTPRYQVSSTQSLCLFFVPPDSDVLQCFLSSGVLQSWAAGTPGGDERWEAGTAHHSHTGQVQGLPDESGVQENDGKKVDIYSYLACWVNPHHTPMTWKHLKMRSISINLIYIYFSLVHFISMDVFGSIQWQ